MADTTQQQNTPLLNLLQNLGYNPDNAGPVEQQILDSMNPNDIQKLQSDPQAQQSLLKTLQNAREDDARRAEPAQNQAIEDKNNEEELSKSAFEENQEKPDKQDYTPIPPKPKNLAPTYPTSTTPTPTSGTPATASAPSVPSISSSATPTAPTGAPAVNPPLSSVIAEPAVPSAAQSDDKNNTLTQLNNIKSLYSSDKLPSQVDFGPIFKQLDEQANDKVRDVLNEPSPDYGKSINDNLREIRSQVNDLKEQKQRAFDSSAGAQLMEQIGLTLTQIFAGFYGIKHGINLSGIKFDKVDWEARLRTRLDSIQNDISDLRTAETKTEERRKEQVSTILQSNQDQKRAIVEQAKQRVSELSQDNREFRHSVVEMIIAQHRTDQQNQHTLDVFKLRDDLKSQDEVRQYQQKQAANERDFQAQVYLYQQNPKNKENTKRFLDATSRIFSKGNLPDNISTYYELIQSVAPKPGLFGQAADAIHQKIADSISNLFTTRMKNGNAPLLNTPADSSTKPITDTRPSALTTPSSPSGAPGSSGISGKVSVRAKNDVNLSNMNIKAGQIIQMDKDKANLPFVQSNFDPVK